MSAGDSQRTERARLTFIERIERLRLDNVQHHDDLPHQRRTTPTFRALTFSLTCSSAKNFNSFNSLSVRSANIECSNGATFLIATLVPVARCTADTTTP